MLLFSFKKIWFSSPFFETNIAFLSFVRTWQNLTFYATSSSMRLLVYKMMHLLTMAQKNKGCKPVTVAKTFFCLRSNKVQIIKAWRVFFAFSSRDRAPFCQLSSYPYQLNGESAGRRRLSNSLHFNNVTAPARWNCSEKFRTLGWWLVAINDFFFFLFFIFLFITHTII